MKILAFNLPDAPLVNYTLQLLGMKWAELTNKHGIRFDKSVVFGNRVYVALSDKDYTLFCLVWNCGGPYFTPEVSNIDPLIFDLY